MIATGYLHDVIEKTDADARELRTRFGLTIANLVLALTEDARITRYEERKAALLDQVATAGREALIVFAADKISKARDLGRGKAWTAQQSTAAREPRLTHYQHSLRLLEQLLPDSPLLAS